MHPLKDAAPELVTAYSYRSFPCDLVWVNLGKSMIFVCNLFFAKTEMLVRNGRKTCGGVVAARVKKTCQDAEFHP